MPGRRKPVAKHREIGQLDAGGSSADGSQSRVRRSEGAPAPGLPMLRTSERGSVKFCEWEWNLAYNLRVKPIVDKPALRYGTLIHKALAMWYVPGVKRGIHPAIAFEAVYNEELARVGELFGIRDEDDQWVDALELGIAMLTNYVDEYGNDDEWEVIATEQPFEVVVTREVRTEKWPYSRVEPWFLYVGVVDGVWRHRPTKHLWVPDHKTTAGIGGTTAHPKMPPHLQLNDQAGAYWSYGVKWLYQKGILKEGEKLAGMLYNFLRKQAPDERQSKFVRGSRVYLNLDGSISKKQPAPYFARFPIQRDEYDRKMAMRRAETEYRRIELLRAGELEIIKSPGEMTCKMCWARDLCELHETGHDYQSMLASTTRQWDPYAEHEIYDGR